MATKYDKTENLVESVDVLAVKVRSLCKTRNEKTSILPNKRDFFDILKFIKL